MTPILVFLLGLAALMVIIAGAGIFWAIKNGQFEDMEGPAHRILMDDDSPVIPNSETEGGKKNRGTE